MKITDTHPYDLDVDTLFQVFGNAEGIKDKLEAMGARNIDIQQCDLTEDKLNIKIVREVPAEVPKAMKKFLGEWNKIIQIESWTGTPGESYMSNFTVETEGVPVKVSGTAKLSTQGSGSVNEFSVDIDCSIPLVGKKLAEFIGAKMKEELQKEYQYTVKALAEA